MKVVRAVLYECVNAGSPTKDNATLPTPRAIYEGEGHRSILKALREFSESIDRCSLVLELSDGQELTLIPTLSDEPGIQWPKFTPQSEHCAV